MKKLKMKVFKKVQGQFQFKKNQITSSLCVP